MFRLSDEQQAKLIAEAVRRGVTTATLIREYADSLPQPTTGES